VRLHYLEWPGEGDRLVLLHANGFHARLWEPVVARFRSARHVIAPDLRGHGDSERPEDGYGWGSLAADVEALLRRIVPDRCRLAGHSVGGYIAALCAARLPDRVGGLVLLDPVIQPERHYAGGAPLGKSLAEVALRRRNRWESVDEAKRSLRKGPFAAWHREMFDAYVEGGVEPSADGGVSLKCPPRVEAAVFRNTFSLSPWPALGMIRCPTLIIRAGSDHGLASTTSPRVARAIPGAVEQVWPEADHFLPMEFPDRVAAAIEEFIDRAP
jgi:pimeloyl-ACP methyl ester carboxylesterase